MFTSDFYDVTKDRTTNVRCRCMPNRLTNNFSIPKPAVARAWLSVAQIAYSAT